MTEKERLKIEKFKEEHQGVVNLKERHDQECKMLRNEIVKNLSNKGYGISKSDIRVENSPRKNESPILNFVENRDVIASYRLFNNHYLASARKEWIENDKTLFKTVKESSGESYPNLLESEKKNSFKFFLKSVKSYCKEHGMYSAPEKDGGKEMDDR